MTYEYTDGPTLSVLSCSIANPVSPLKAQPHRGWGESQVWGVIRSPNPESRKKLGSGSRQCLGMGVSPQEHFSCPHDVIPLASLAFFFFCVPGSQLFSQVLLGHMPPPWPKSGIPPQSFSPSPRLALFSISCVIVFSLDSPRTLRDTSH